MREAFALREIAASYERLLEGMHASMLHLASEQRVLADQLDQSEVRHLPQCDLTRSPPKAMRSPWISPYLTRSAHVLPITSHEISTHLPLACPPHQPSLFASGALRWRFPHERPPSHRCHHLRLWPCHPALRSLLLPSSPRTRRRLRHFRCAISLPRWPSHIISFPRWVSLTPSLDGLLSPCPACAPPPGAGVEGSASYDAPPPALDPTAIDNLRAAVDAAVGGPIGGGSSSSRYTAAAMGSARSSRRRDRWGSISSLSAARLL